MSAQMAAVLSLLTQDQWRLLARKAGPVVEAMGEDAHPAVAALARIYAGHRDQGRPAHQAAALAADEVLSRNLFSEPDPAAHKPGPTIASAAEVKAPPALPPPGDRP